MPARLWRRAHATFRSLPDMAFQLRQLQKQVEELQKQLAEK